MTAAITPAEHWRLGYRPALDGLRGVAVMLVIGQHAWVPGFARAGEVGVTLFFVLSGFLITTLLLEERRRTGRTDLWAFYMRRIRRLIPALAIFLAAMALIGVGWRIIAATALYSANWAQIYWVDMSPIGHVWSLSVEEQFYILWPLGFMAFGPRRYLLVGGIAVCIALRMGSWILTGNHDLAFYATFTRADALLAGCLLAVVFQRRPWQPRRWMVGAAVAALTVASFFPYHAFVALAGLTLATAGSVVLIAVAAQRSPPVLNWRPLTYIGGISYGLYLWHGPLLHWGIYARVEPTTMVGLVAAALAIAAISYRFVEEPIRRGPVGRRSAGRLAHPT